MDNRAFPRRAIQVACTIEIPGGVFVSGYTANLSAEGAMVQSGTLADPGRRVPKAGDVGVITFGFRAEGRREVLKIACRVMHCVGQMIGVQLSVNQIGLRQRELFAALLGTT